MPPVILKIPFSRWVDTNHFIIHMNKINIWLSALVLMLVISCGDSKKEKEELDKKLDVIETVEQEVDSTVQKVEEKAAEVQSAISELDSI